MKEAIEFALFFVGVGVTTVISSIPVLIFLALLRFGGGV